MNSRDTFNEALIGIAKGIGRGIVWLTQFLWMAQKSKPIKASPLSLDAEHQQLQSLLANTKAAYKESKFFQHESIEAFSAHIIITAFGREGIEPTNENIEPFHQMVCYLLAPESLFFNLDYEIPERLLTSEQIALKRELKKLHRIYQSHQAFSAIEFFLTEIVTFTIASVPREIIEAGGSINPSSLYIEAGELTKKPNESCDWLFRFCFGGDIEDFGLFEQLQAKLLDNIHNVSGILKRGVELEPDKWIFPEDSTLTGTALFEAYLADTPFIYCLKRPVPFILPIESRFEHLHLLAGTGHGKTQTLQTLILEDIRDSRGFMVIDSQGDLISKIRMLEVFGSGGAMEDKLIVVDPTDIEYPAALNLFALGELDTENLTALQKETVINGTVDLYTYLFGAILGAELTQRQGVVFTYIARLMLEIPKANIHTLRELMEDGKKFKPYMDKLRGTAHAFFKTEFFSPTFAQTKKQVLARLWGILANATLERMFSADKNKVDIFSAMNEGKVVLINTAKDLLRSEGSQILGRFFIAMLGQAILLRSSIAQQDRRDFLVYIDECHEYLDEKVNTILEQARKYRVGLNLSHQNLAQLPAATREAIFANTSIKLAGGVSASDASKLSAEMHTKTDTLLSVQKHQDHTDFCLWIKNTTSGVIPLSIPFGLLENEPILSQDDYLEQIDSNRKQYCISLSEVNYASGSETVAESNNTKAVVQDNVQSNTSDDQAFIQQIRDEIPLPTDNNAKQLQDASSESEAIIPEAEPTVKGKGSQEHKYMQGLVRKEAQSRGFKAIVEQSVLSGKGAVDVAIETSKKKIAVEISITTDPKWESQNVAKCLNAGFDKVAVLANDVEHLDKLRAVIEPKFDNEVRAEKILFFLRAHFINYLDELKINDASSVTKHRGWQVKTSFTSVPDHEQKQKQAMVAKSILGL